jgi:hypothetical protein
VIDSALQREVAFRFAGCESECCGASLSIRLLDGPLIGVSVFRVSKGGDGHSAILSHVHSGASASFFHTPSHLYIHTPDMSVVGRAGECGGGVRRQIKFGLTGGGGCIHPSCWADRRRAWLPSKAASDLYSRGHPCSFSDLSPADRLGGRKSGESKVVTGQFSKSWMWW